MSNLTIGRVAQRAGVNLQTIRYYQRRGLISEPPKPYAGIRRYGPDIVMRVRFIKRAQGLGFTLKEVQELLDLGDGNCADVQIMAGAKLDGIREQIKDLQCIQNVLEHFLDECRQTREPGRCSMIEAISTGACCEHMN